MGPLPDDVAAALEGWRWQEAYRLLAERSAAVPLSADELEALGTTAYLTGREEEAFERWAEGHRACLRAGDVPGAARFGIRLSHGLGFKGDIGRAAGWVERLRRVLDDGHADRVEHGYLDHAAAMCRIFQDGDLAGARDLFARAAKVADRHRDRALRTLAHIGEGRCLIYLGELAEGVALLDEAMVAVEERELPPTVVGDAYCTVIDAVHELFDVRRSEAWTESFTRWCEAQPDLVLYRGHCLLHRAEVLQLHGRLDEAGTMAGEACRRLAHPVNLLVLGGAQYVEAEIHRLRGDAAEAERGYQRAHELGCEPHPGLSLLRLAQGRVDVADAAIRRVLAQAEQPIGRARVLGPYAEIVLAAGDVEAAGGAAAELGAIAAELGSPLLRAHAAHAGGAARLAAGDPSGAAVSLRRAAMAWTELDAPYDLARTRLVLAAACEAVGDHEGAAMERRAAAATFGQLGIPAEGAAGPVGGAGREASGGLTARELEVLALVARGRSNRAVAEELFISEKTVVSHLSHIFTKIGVSSRSAATGYAYQHGLV